jgi:acetoin utilization protein AcuC
VWTALVAEALHRPLGQEGIEQPNWLRWPVGLDIHNAIDWAIYDTRRHVFPLWGLDPLRD